jgi:hypothetical protein
MPPVVMVSPTWASFEITVPANGARTIMFCRLASATCTSASATATACLSASSRAAEASRCASAVSKSVRDATPLR